MRSCNTLRQSAIVSNTASASQRSAWRRDTAAILVICLFGGLLFFYHLGQGSLHDWDDAIYAQVAKEMARSGDWLTEHYEYKPWFEKPPLFIWSTALLFRLFGITEFWARAASALFGIAVLILTYAIGRYIYSRWVGVISVLVMLTSVLYLRYARRAMIETTLIFFLVLAIYGYLHLQRGGQRWWYAVWAALALAIMSKSFAASFALATLALAIVFEGRTRSVLRSKHFWLGALLAVLIVAPWHVLMYLHHGTAFLNAYLFFNASRLTNTLEGNAGGPTFYLSTLDKGMFPWFYLVPFALGLSVWENLRGNVRSRILLLFVAVTFIICTVVRTKILWYILPLCPPLAILIASMLVDAWRSPRSFGLAGLLVGTFAVALVSSQHAVVVVGVCVVLIVAIFLLWLYRQASWALAFTCSAFLLLSGIYNIRLVYAEGDSPIARLGRMSRASSASDRDPLILYSGISAPAAVFYSDRPVIIVDTRQGLTDALSHDESHRIILNERDIPSLRPEYSIDVAATISGIAYGRISHSYDLCTTCTRK